MPAAGEKLCVASVVVQLSPWELRLLRCFGIVRGWMREGFAVDNFPIEVLGGTIADYRSFEEESFVNLW